MEHAGYLPRSATLISGTTCKSLNARLYTNRNTAYLDNWQMWPLCDGFVVSRPTVVFEPVVSDIVHEYIPNLKLKAKQHEILKYLCDSTKEQLVSLPADY